MRSISLETPRNEIGSHIVRPNVICNNLQSQIEFSCKADIGWYLTDDDLFQLVSLFLLSETTFLVNVS